MASAQKLLLEGVSDAVCFMLGALAGYGLTLALGMDIFAEGYSGSSILGNGSVALILDIPVLHAQLLSAEANSLAGTAP